MLGARRWRRPGGARRRGHPRGPRGTRGPRAGRAGQLLGEERRQRRPGEAAGRRGCLRHVLPFHPVFVSHLNERDHLQVRDDGQDSGVGSVDDGHSRDESPELNPKPVAGAAGAAPYPQYEDDSGDLLKPSNPAYPTVDPGFSRRAARDPTIQSYPEPERVREQGYPEMFTTETDLAAPAEAEDRDQSPPPPPPAQREPTLPRVEGAALKCGRYPRRGNPPPRPYARAQFAVVAPEPESPADSPQQRVPTPGPALANAYSSFQVAKQLHKENLEHNPLPDTVNDDLFKKLNSQRHPNPGIALDVVPDAAAVGWRSFNAPGPTNCSKMKVYRPKTAAPAGIRHNGLQERMQRPSTGHPGKLLAKDHVSEMDLAICWDLVPAFAEDEPKPTPHIDGSNGSAAPGIFSLVHHPADNEEDARANGSGHCSGGPRRTSTPPAAMERRTPPKPPSVESVHSGSGSGQHKSGCGPPDHALHERLHAQERQRAAPSPPPLRRPKSEYKMAFKAGKPATSLSTNSSFDTPPSQHSGGCNGAGGCSGAAVRVPKQRAPFARKNYAITSLTQPFSLWPKETGHAYPEHWRLASVYQHSFKPVHARSKPLLKTVYQ
ncbi:hypothetical protein ONE63_002101 [Megalurothrips usitatus]|uniref:DUF4812 domain-containing protein n=1 Tax=Megalurothrips usitatus TaxID=439358 RepID=A0AAV7XBF9_9NEOP|nr:hypothetical protein ONE63_002101 [Megalurothrips usitatus]